MTLCTPSNFPRRNAHDLDALLARLLEHAKRSDEIGWACARIAGLVREVRADVSTPLERAGVHLIASALLQGVEYRVGDPIRQLELPEGSGQ